MAEKRLISSSIWRDEWFGPLAPFDKCLWIGLFSACADDQGRLQDNVVLIRADVFPYDDVPIAKIEEVLGRFVDAGKLYRYEAGGKKLIQIVNWWEHQQQQWAMPSAWPAPPGWLDHVRSNIKGQYVELNWHGKAENADINSTWTPQMKQPEVTETVTQVDTPGGDSTWDVQVDGHVLDPDPVLDPDRESGGAGAPSKTSPAPPKPRKRRSAADPRTRSEQIQLARTIGGSRYPPKELYDDIIAALGESPYEDRLRLCRKAWVERGYNPSSWEWLTDWYVHGIPTRPNGNGSNSSASRASPVTPRQGGPPGSDTEIMPSGLTRLQERMNECALAELRQEAEHEPATARSTSG